MKCNAFSCRENEKLAADNADLELRSTQLEDAVQGQLLPPPSKIDADTLVDKMLNLLARLIKVLWNPNSYLGCHGVGSLRATL